jgi:alcohol dehydrogenase
LAKKAGIPAGLRTLGVEADNISLLADNKLKDVCGLTNRRFNLEQASHEEICKIFLAAM